MCNYQQALERGLGLKWVGVSTKVCPQCGVEKLVENFSWNKDNGRYYPGFCNQCTVIASLKTRKSNIEHGLCGKCGKPKKESESKIFCRKCQDKSNASTLRNIHERGGKERNKRLKKEWRENGGREWTANYVRNRNHTDSDFYWRNWVANETNRAFQGNMSDKSSLELLGLSIAEFQEYLGWLWPVDENGQKLPRELVHIDHIIPLNYGYGKSDHVKSQLCHFTNLMPIASNENLSKGGVLPDGFHSFWFEQFEQEATS